MWCDFIGWTSIRIYVVHSHIWFFSSCHVMEISSLICCSTNIYGLCVCALLLILMKMLAFRMWFLVMGIWYFDIENKNLSQDHIPWNKKFWLWLGVIRLFANHAQKIWIGYGKSPHAIYIMWIPTYHFSRCYWKSCCFRTFHVEKLEIVFMWFTLL